VGRNAKLLVGIETGDDAGVYQLADDICLIQTVDIITPIVDDPFLFGSVAAANALSDIYAMGGQPLTALNIVGFPSCSLPISVLLEILKGGLEKIREAGALLVGGHTVDDNELKYGLSVTGTVHPSRIVKNRNASTGDFLILTKPLGTGIIATALKGKVAREEHVHAAAASMAALNRLASELMVEAGAHACTDITGFGLIGHAATMAQASRATFSLDARQIPLLEGALDYASRGMIPGGAYNNEKFYSPRVKLDTRLSGDQLMALYDPQTSGGLLISVEKKRATALVERLKDGGIQEAAIVGEVIAQGDYDIIIH
jgi:selenide,water dikinase